MNRRFTWITGGTRLRVECVPIRSPESDRVRLPELQVTKLTSLPGTTIVRTTS